MPVFPMRALSRALSTCVLLAASAASAADLALILGVSDYDRLRDVSQTDDLRPLVGQLDSEGFEVIELFDGSQSDMLEIADRFRRSASDADRVLIVLEGHFVSSGTDAWLLARDARSADLLTAPAAGVSLSALAQIAGDAAAGRAVMLVGRSSELRPGDGLRSGTQGMDVPQGVTLARGTLPQIREAIFNGLLREGVSLNEALAQLAARGFLSDTVGYAGGRAAAPSPVDTEAITERASEEGFWNAVQAINTTDALALYIQRYPRGRFVNDAKQRIADLEADQANRWETLENQLDLSRNDRRQIQRDLTLLGYNTRGVDGIFGQGSRGAIGRWQRDRAYEVTGFLTRRQWEQITQEARERRAAQEAEERRADEAYWQDTGARGTIESLRAYLERYPRGRFAEEARNRLDELEAAAEDEDRRAARRAWRRASEIDTIDGYADFIRQFPESRFVDDARQRIADLEGPNNDRLIETAREQERQILTNPVTRLLAEQRLGQLGYKPGLIDGNFDGNTRNAIKRFQRDRGIFESGYVTNRTAGFLLAGR